MLKKLKKEVYEANMALPRYGLVTFTWGNVSGIDTERCYMVIKPSGVAYEDLTPELMSVVSLKGKHISGGKPSSDTNTHLALYNRYSQIKGIVHTHSVCATACAQAGVAIQCLGTTHADYFYGAIPVTRAMTDDEINGSYEAETGNVIIETLDSDPTHRDPMYVPAVLVSNHGPFVWGDSPDNAVHNAVVLEEAAKMFILSHSLNPNISGINQTLLDKHFLRKHGANAYYGQ
ncbi:MAG: L-ribulose-5-phosphate 4-epimerase [Clostridiales bacterium]|jgi:L-ribulose-5-phosphate 4-epimerase|nr:L-ribulose-5-phosphate 4-epimerase [Clostridiales bacterium]